MESTPFPHWPDFVTWSCLAPRAARKLMSTPATKGHLNGIIQWQQGEPGGSGVKNLLANTGDAGDAGSIPGLGWPPGGGNGNPLQNSCLENPHGHRRLVGYSSWGRKEWDTSQQLTAHTHTHTHTHLEVSFPVQLPSPKGTCVIAVLRGKDYIGMQLTA